LAQSEQKLGKVNFETFEHRKPPAPSA
jgi:hypothetical protein